MKEEQKLALARWIGQVVAGVLFGMGLWTFLVLAPGLDQPVRFWVGVAGILGALLGLEWMIRVVVRQMVVRDLAALKSKRDAS